MSNRKLLWIILITSVVICMHGKRKAFMRGKARTILQAVRDVQNGVLSVQHGMDLLNAFEDSGSVDDNTKHLLEQEKLRLKQLEEEREKEKYFGTLIWILSGVTIGLVLLFLAFFSKWICNKVKTKHQQNVAPTM